MGAADKSTFCYPILCKFVTKLWQLRMENLSLLLKSKEWNVIFFPLKIVEKYYISDMSRPYQTVLLIWFGSWEMADIIANSRLLTLKKKLNCRNYSNICFVICN